MFNVWDQLIKFKIKVVYITFRILGWVVIFSRQINRDAVEVILVRPWRNPCPVW